jgi:hypothetical protein
VPLKEPAPGADPLGVNSDRGDIVLGWLTKLVGTLAVLGLIGFDAVSLAAAHFSAEDRAQTAARAASSAYTTPADLQKAYEAAHFSAAEQGDSIAPTDFTIGSDGRVTLTLQRTAPTLLLEKIAPLRHWAEVRTTVSATRPG